MVYFLLVCFMSMRCGEYLVAVSSNLWLKSECSGRQGLVSTKKIKNNLLASVLILTVIPSSVKVGRGVIEQCYHLISQKLLEVDEVCHESSKWITDLIASPDLSDSCSMLQDPHCSIHLGQHDASPKCKSPSSGIDRIHRKDDSTGWR